MTSADDIQYVRWDPTGGQTRNNDAAAFSMLTPRSGAEAMARLAAQAEEEQRLHEQGFLAKRPIDETTNNRPSTTSNTRRSQQQQQQLQPASSLSGAADATKKNVRNSNAATSSAGAVSISSQKNINPSIKQSQAQHQQHHLSPHYHLNLDSQQRSHPVTPVQVLLQVQESLEHAVQTADRNDAPELSGPEPQPDYVPVEGSVGIPKFRTFLEQEEYRAQQHANNRAMSAISASLPRGLLNNININNNNNTSASASQFHSGGQHLGGFYAASEIIPDDSVSRIHGLGGRDPHSYPPQDHHSDAHSTFGDDFDGEQQQVGNRTPRGGNANNKSSPYRTTGGGEGGHRPLTPRSTVYVTNAVTARFVSERFEASVRDSLIQQEYEHRMDLMRYFYQQTSGIQQREARSQLREALEQQYLARAEVEELRGAIALRLSDIEEVSRLRIEQIASGTRVNLEREVSRLYGIVAAGQHASQQQWLLGCEERERHFISSESDRVWSRLAGNYLSEGHSLQLKAMLKDRIPVSHSRVANDALETVREAPRAQTPLQQFPAHTASAQINVASNYNNNSSRRTGAFSDDADQQVLQVQNQPQQQQQQQPIQIRSLRSARASRPKTPPSHYNTPRETNNNNNQQQQQQQQQHVGDDVAPVNPESLILPKKSPKRSTAGTPRGPIANRFGSAAADAVKSGNNNNNTSASSQQQNVGGAIEITQLDGPSDDQQYSSSAGGAGAGGHSGRRSGSGRIGVAAAARKPTASSGASLLDEPVPVPNTPRPAGAMESGPAETLADRRKKARLEKKQEIEAARDEKKRLQQEQVELRRQEIEERQIQHQQQHQQQQQQRATSAPGRVSPGRSSRSGGGGGGGVGGGGGSSSGLIDRPLPNVFPEYWGWMFRSLGALHTWQRRLFFLTNNGRLRCASSERGPWVLVTTADRILRVEVDSYHDVSGHGLAPPTTQYHQFGFYLDVVDGEAEAAAAASGSGFLQVRQKRLRFCCFSRTDLTNWMHILRRATETVGQLAELGVPGAISPVRRRFEDLADEAHRLGAPSTTASGVVVAASQSHHHRRYKSPGSGVTGGDGGDNNTAAAAAALHDESSEKLNEWLAQHQDADGNPIQAPPIVPYRARVQLEDEVAVLEAREMKEFEKQKRAESEHRDPSLKHPLAHYNTMTSMGKPKMPHELEQYA